MPVINKILIVDDDEDILLLLKEVLEREGYLVTTASNGVEALEKIYQVIPHLIIMDLLMPKMDGKELAKKIRKDILLSHIPIIMLTGKTDIQTEIDSLNFGVDDFVSKPFQIEELLAKLHSMLERIYRGLDANPLTHLPGNNSIKELIETNIKNNKIFAVSFLDLDNFKAFNDKYGFERGDEALKLTAQIIIESVKKLEKEGDFVGHIGGDDFVFITEPSRVIDICKNIIEQFDKRILSLYDKKDIEKGFIITKNRRGKVEKFPVISISIGVVTNEKRKILHSLQVSEIGTELKKFAKTIGKSNYVLDERKSEEAQASYPLAIGNVKDNVMELVNNDFVSVVSDVKDFINSRGNVAVIYIDIIPSIESDKEVASNISDIIYKLFFDSRGTLMRNKDVVSIYNNKKERIFIYLSSARNQAMASTNDIEKIIQRISDKLKVEGVKKDCKCNIVFGYALVNFPFSKI